MMIRESLAHALPEPNFQQRGGEFSTVIGRDWLTEQILSGLNLNDRQARAVLIVKKGGRLDNKEYQKLFSVSKPTASRDLDELAGKGILAKIGITGKGTYYILDHKGLTKGSKGSQRAQVKDINETFSQGTRAPGGGVAPDIDAKSPLCNKGKRQAHDGMYDPLIAQVDTESNIIKGTVLQELAETLGIPAAQVIKVLDAATSEAKTREHLQTAADIAHREHFRKFYVEPMVESGWLERTIPVKPTSRFQRYRLTDKGRAWLANARTAGKRSS